MAVNVFLCTFATVMNEIKKKRYEQALALVVIVLAFFRLVCTETPNVNGYALIASDTSTLHENLQSESGKSPNGSLPLNDSLYIANELSDNSSHEKKPFGRHSMFFNADGTPVKNRIYSVSNFGKAFPDQNDVQLLAATKHGVEAVNDREDAERRKSELVYVGSSPFYHVDRLKSSIPYLVPRAAVLLQDIGRNFFDSLQTKQIPLHKIIVTSVLRSKADVARLRLHNGNATENSCHLYGTTFDICYNRYRTVEDPEGPQRRRVRNDSLKWVLSEVLNDMRRNKRCLVKYEVHQGCFHITVN